MHESRFTELITRIEIEGSTLESDSVYKEILEFNSLVTTSCESAATCLFSLAASVCCYKPQLERAMVRNAVRPLFFLGIEQTADVIKWIEWFCQEMSGLGNAYNQIRPTENGIHWLKREIPERQYLVELVLTELKAMRSLDKILSTLRFDYDNSIASLGLGGQAGEQEREFFNYRELVGCLVERLHEHLSYYEDSDLQMLVDEELFEHREDFRRIGWL